MGWYGMVVKNLGFGVRQMCWYITFGKSHTADNLCLFPHL